MHLTDCVGEDVWPSALISVGPWEPPHPIEEGGVEASSPTSALNVGALVGAVEGPSTRVLVNEDMLVSEE